MEIKDLAGVSKPITKLIEVISSGIGAVSRPYLIRKEADATAYQIRVISEAIATAEKIHCVPVISKDGIVEAWKAPGDGTFKLEATDSLERSRLRLEHQEERRQRNVEEVTSRAAEEIAGVTEASDASVDSDWIARFFGSVQDVSSDQMQILWARVLAGEVLRPGTFSLRTLDFMRNLTAKNAKLIEKIASYVCGYHGTMFVSVIDVKQFN